MNSKLNPNYICGLVDGEGCFCISFNNHKNGRIEVRLLFEVELRADDLEILKRLKTTLECGNIYKLDYMRYQKWKPHCKYKVSNIVDITQKVIPFFKKYPLQAKKKISFKSFCKAAELITAKMHLTNNGVTQIRKLRVK